MAASYKEPRWFFDENSLGVAKALQHVRGDVTWPGNGDGLVPEGAADSAWLPIIGREGLVVLTRDNKIRTRPVEQQALLDAGVRACFLTSGGTLSNFDQLRLWLRNWDRLEELAAGSPGPWLMSVTSGGVAPIKPR